MFERKNFAAEVHRRGIQTDIPDDWSPAEELLEVPGIKRNEYEERFYTREYPLRSWFLSRQAFVQHFFEVGVSELMERFGQIIKDQQKSCVRSAHLAPAALAKEDEDLTDYIRQEAFQLGFTMVGFRPYEPKYAYTETKNDIVIKKNVIALGLEQPYEPTQQMPSDESEAAVFALYVKLVGMALQLGDRVRAKGYRAEVFHPVDPSTPMLILPYFVDAGLGQMGANGQLLSPYVGSRARLTVITTDAPVSFDEPVDYGLPRFCAKCQVCVERCPGRALTRKEISWRGVTKYKTISNRCAPMTATYGGCGVCMAVCPIQKYGYHRVMENYRQTGEVLGKGTDELEGYRLKDKGYYGPGKMPTFKKGEVISPGIEQKHGDPNEPY